MYITLNEARSHLNITDEFFTEDDIYIKGLIAAAENAVANDIDRPLEDCMDPNSGDLYPSLKHAMLMLIGSAYSYRESITVQNIKKVPIYDLLVNPYRRTSIA